MPVTEWGRNEMSNMHDTGVAAGTASGGRNSHTHRLRRLAGTGFIAALTATAATTLAAALAHSVGVDFEVPDGGETIPLTGFAVVTGFFSVVGIVIAVGFLRRSAHRAERFVWTTVSLTWSRWSRPSSPGQTPAPPPPSSGCTSSQRRCDPHPGAAAPQPDRLTIPQRNDARRAAVPTPGAQ